MSVKLLMLHSLASVITSQGGREYMEDYHVIKKNIVLGVDIYAVFDGHGGKEVSEFLSNVVCDVVTSELYTPHKFDANAMFRIFKNCNELMLKAFPDRTKLNNVGSTALVMLLDKQNWVMYIGNAGDCRACILDKHQFKRITNDHKPQYEERRIRAVGGTIISVYGIPRLNGSLSVSRGFGDLSFLPSYTWKPEVTTVDLRRHGVPTFMCMASDGIWDVIDEHDLSFIVKHDSSKSDSLYEVCKIVNTEARKKGSLDNITFMAISIHQ